MITDAIIDHLEDGAWNLTGLYIQLEADCGATIDEVQDALIQLENEGRIEGYYGTDSMPCVRLKAGYNADTDVRALRFPGEGVRDNPGTRIEEIPRMPLRAKVRVA